MAGFKASFTKYDENGNRVPKGIGELKKFKEKNPNLLIFDSKSEYTRYKELKELEKDGLIQDLQLQVKFELLPSTKWYNNVLKKQTIVRETTYIADFVYTENGKNIVEDCKGWKQAKKNGVLKWTVFTDDVYKLKKKILLNRYPDIIFKES
jgi:hypothetical protein